MNRSNQDRWQDQRSYGRIYGGGRGDHQEQDRQWFGQFGGPRPGQHNDDFEDDDDRSFGSSSGRGYRQREYRPGDYGHGGYEYGSRPRSGFDRDDDQDSSPRRSRYFPEYRQRDEYGQFIDSGRGYARSHDDDDDDYGGSFTSRGRSNSREYDDDYENYGTSGHRNRRSNNLTHEDRVRGGRNSARSQGRDEYGQFEGNRGGRSSSRYNEDFDPDRGRYGSYRETGNRNRSRQARFDDDDNGYRRASRRSSY